MSSLSRVRSSYMWKCMSSACKCCDGLVLRGTKVGRICKADFTDTDCCSVCHEPFTLPCQANCRHWFCGECILRVWEYGSALLPCKCPICRRPITHLWPSEDSASDVPILTDIATYNLNFDNRVVTTLQRWLHWMIFQLKFPDTDFRALHVLHLAFLLLLSAYLAGTLTLMLQGT